MNVAIMLWRCLLVMFCGNVVATFLKLSWNMLQQLTVPTFSQLPPNVVETLLQPYIVSWIDLSNALLFSTAFYLQCALKFSCVLKLVSEPHDEA